MSATIVGVQVTLEEGGYWYGISTDAFMLSHLLNTGKNEGDKVFAVKIPLAGTRFFMVYDFVTKLWRETE
jgi:hypothetical protein